MSLSEGEVRNPYRTVGVVCARLSERKSHEDIAKELHFGSVEDMRAQLKDWDLPDWIAGEETTAAPKNEAQEKDVRERRARNSGLAIELPPPSNASGLFEEAIDVMTRAVEALKHSRPEYRGGRFVDARVYKDPVYFPRSSFTEEQWLNLCELYGHDPGAKGFLDTEATTRAPTGGSRYPPRPLVMLIGAYALADRYMGDLIKVLHPDPAKADAKEISRLLYGTKTEDDKDGLLRRAEQLAELICGGDGKRGVRISLSAREHNAACLITHRRGQDWTHSQIYEELAQSGFSEEEVDRLGEFQLQWPED